MSAGLSGGVGMSDTLRERMLSVAVALVGEVGYARMSVERVVRLSGNSQETFYRCFEDLDGCLLAAFEDALARIADVTVPAYESEDEWPAKVRAALVSLLAFVEDEPAVGTFVFVGALGAGPKVLACRMEAVERLKLAFEHGIDELGGVAGREIGESSPLTAEGAVNGVLGILHTRMLEGSPLARRPLSELTGPLTAMIVLPYLGHVVAGRELAPGRSRSPEAFPVGMGDGAASNGHVAASNRHDHSGRMLQGLEVRVTERGFRVLAAIEERNARGSSPSNREIADVTGIKDQGQISKLMQHLARLGLVEHTGARVLKGKPYAWRLTVKGTELLRELEAQAAGRKAVAGSSSSNGAGASTSNGAATSNGHDRSAVTKAMLEGLEPRIGQREREVLAAIDELNARGSSPSNHAIRDATELEDHAEVSKLLKQLARLGLVESTATGRGTYAWRLTGKGIELLRELAGQAVGASRVSAGLRAEGVVNGRGAG
jgi:AcrR family transcriptional regulator/DNA-binding MarR family transcriptional regulator